MQNGMQDDDQTGGGFFSEFLAPDNQLALVIEDDGRVAYAYLVDAVSQKICGDVWLYNRLPAPIQPEWKLGNNAPFLNPAEYVKSFDGFFFPQQARMVFL